MPYQIPRYLFKILLGVIAWNTTSCTSLRNDQIFITPFDDKEAQKNFLNDTIGKTTSHYNSIRSEDELSVKDLNADISKSDNSIKSNIYKVDLNGFIHMGQLGKVQVGGLDKHQAAQAISEAFEINEVRSPSIQVEILNMHVTILGEVLKQGNYPIKREDYGLTDLIGDAQGFLPSANRNKIKIFRGDRINPEVLLVSMRDYNFLKSRKSRLQSHDIVYVEPQKSASLGKKFATYSPFLQITLLLSSTLFIILKR